MIFPTLNEAAIKDGLAKRRDSEHSITNETMKWFVSSDRYVLS